MTTTLEPLAPAAVDLPAPTRERWQPLRAGLLNLYRYDYEEFHFEQGRLLLRGNNGTGKSRVLALQLPFLLDADTSPHRLEPDGDQAKRIEWNLLLGKYPDRLGYTWLEFGRRDPDGTEYVVTLGCGLHAVAGRGLAGKWFFVTSQRVGRDLFLQRPNGTALTRDRLIEALGEHGEVLTTATAYRRCVDEALFGLGEHRYGALVDLLVQLRQPQLSRQLDERRLSTALSEALPPVSPAIIGDVAEALRSLESDRNALDALLAAGAGVDAFLAEYRRYTQIVARRRAAAVRTLQSDYETTMRKLRSAESAHEQAASALRAATGRLEQLTNDEAAAERAVQTLAASDRMRSAHALDRARADADARAHEAREATREHARASHLRDQRDAEHDTARQRAATSRVGVEEAAGLARERAEATGLGRHHDEACAPLALPDGPDDPSAPSAVEGASQATARAAADRHRAATHVQTLQVRVDQAADALRQARAAQQLLSDQLDEAVEAHQTARDHLDETAAALGKAYRAWADEVRELTAPDPDGVLWELEHWARTGEGASPVAEAVGQAKTAAAAALARLRVDAEGRLADAQAHLGGLREEQARLCTGGHTPPPSPHTRAAEDRATRPGAPLWLLCDFAPEADEPTRAGIEAALEAAGLLDAWVTPDGRLLRDGEHDTVLVAGTSPVPESNLAALLVCAVDRDDPQATAVADETVTAVLRHIGLRAAGDGDLGVRGSGGTPPALVTKVGSGGTPPALVTKVRSGGTPPAPVTSALGPVWVAPDGRWQAGPLHGAWSKPAAEHLGQGAREAARRRRLAELAEEITAGERAVEAVRAELADLDRRREVADDEAAAAPDDTPVRQALAALDGAARAVQGLRGRLVEADDRVATRRSALETVTTDRDSAAADLGLSDWVVDLPGLFQALAAYREACAALWPTLRGHLDIRRHVDDAAGRACQAAEAEARQAASAAEAGKRAVEAAAERDTLQATVGAEVEEVLAELKATRERVGAVRAALTEAREAQSQARTSLAVAERDITAFTETLAADARRRQEAVDTLGAYVATGLLAVAHPEFAGSDPVGKAAAQRPSEGGDLQGWSVDRAVRTARRIEQLLTDIESDDPAWQRTQRGIHLHLQSLVDALLPHGYEPSATLIDQVLVVTVPFQGKTCSMTQLRDAITDEIASRQSILDAREREVLENHLIGEVSAHLHDLLRAGEQWVAEVNAELAANPTSTGMTLRFVWRPAPDGPSGLPEARARLLRAGGTWSPREREALGAFLQEQIRAVRAANDTGTWQEHLAVALDYRTWHVFDVERRQDGEWKRLTRRTHGTGSGGEKAIALTLPQFAAAAAHYRSAHPHAPRLILLDEAFVGIDADMRSKCMGLLHAFDLDFVMTSEREWACYPTLPGVAICQLATRPGIDAVGVTRWVWNGQQRVRVDATLPPAAPPAPPAEGEGGTDPDRLQ